MYCESPLERKWLHNLHSTSNAAYALERLHKLHRKPNNAYTCFAKKWPTDYRKCQSKHGSHAAQNSHAHQFPNWRFCGMSLLRQSMVHLKSQSTSTLCRSIAFQMVLSLLKSRIWNTVVAVPNWRVLILQVCTATAWAHNYFLKTSIVQLHHWKFPPALRPRSRSYDRCFCG